MNWGLSDHEISSDSTRLLHERQTAILMFYRCPSIRGGME